jgi:hypothetical protein
MFDSDLDQLIQPKNQVEQNIIQTKSKARIMFD